MTGKIIEFGDLECLEGCEEPNRSGAVILISRDQLKASSNLFGKIVEVKPVIKTEKLVPIKVRFAHWQDLPDDLAARTKGAIFRPRQSVWGVQMFTVLAAAETPMPGGVFVAAGSTVSLATLRANGFEPKIVPVANDLSEPEDNEQRFAFCLKAASDLAEDGDWHFVVSALESALHLAKTNAAASAADESGCVEAK